MDVIQAKFWSTPCGSLASSSALAGLRSAPPTIPAGLRVRKGTSSGPFRSTLPFRKGRCRNERAGGTVSRHVPKDVDDGQRVVARTRRSSGDGSRRSQEEEMRVGNAMLTIRATGATDVRRRKGRSARAHASKAPKWGTVSVDQDIDLDEPFAYVSDLMTELEVVSVKADCTLKKAASLFDTKRISGMPVVDEQGICVGVLSKKDLPGDPYERQRLFENGENIGEYYTSPAICVRGHAHVVEAAAIMLKHKVHRLPVVDKEGKPVGVISRSDVFKPLLNEKAALFNAAVVPEAQVTGRDKQPAEKLEEMPVKEENGTGENREEMGNTVVTQGSEWEAKYLYDGDCSICMNLVSMLKKRDKGRGRIKFVNIADVDYDPDENMYIEFEEAMKTIHVITKDQEIVKGSEALGVLYEAVGLGWVSQLQKVPGLQQLGSAAYELIAKLRLPMEGRSMDALLATRQIEKAASGNAGCVNPDDPCRNLYDDEDGDDALSSYEEFY